MKILNRTFSLFLLFVFAGLSSAAGETPTPDPAETPPRFVIRVDRLEITDMQLFDTLEVTVESFGHLIAGFDLKFGTNSSELEILEVLPGEINDSCDWEYFKARKINSSDEAFPCQLWQAVAIAKITPDTTLPTCFGFEQTASLLRIVVVGEPGFYIPDTVAPVFFFWEDCGDNSLSDEVGGTMIISRQVFDYLGSEISDTGQIFPTRRGAPRQCVKPDILNKPVRQIDFHNGGVTFKAAPPPDSTADTAKKNQ